MDRRNFLRSAGLMGTVAIFPLFLFRRLAGGWAKLRPETYWERRRRTFDPTKQYGRGMEYGGSYSRADVIKWAKSMANKVLPRGTAYIIVDNPHIGRAEALGRWQKPMKVIYWFHGPELKDFWYNGPDLAENKGRSSLSWLKFGGNGAKLIDYCLAGAG